MMCMAILFTLPLISITVQGGGIGVEPVEPWVDELKIERNWWKYHIELGIHHLNGVDAIEWLELSFNTRLTSGQSVNIVNNGNSFDVYSDVEDVSVQSLGVEENNTSSDYVLNLELEILNNGYGGFSISMMDIYGENVEAEYELPTSLPVQMSYYTYPLGAGIVGFVIWRSERRVNEDG